MQEHEYKARDKTVQKMSRDGLREENLRNKEEKRITGRDMDTEVSRSEKKDELDFSKRRREHINEKRETEHPEQSSQKTIYSRESVLDEESEQDIDGKLDGEQVADESTAATKSAFRSESIRGQPRGERAYLETVADSRDLRKKKMVRDYASKERRKEKEASEESKTAKREAARYRETSEVAEESLDGFSEEIKGKSKRERVLKEQRKKSSRLSFGDESDGMVHGAGIGIRSSASAVKDAAATAAHWKTHEAEEDNAAVEGAHRAELAGESLARKSIYTRERLKQRREQSKRLKESVLDEAEKSRLMFESVYGNEAKNMVKKEAEQKRKSALQKLFQKKRYQKQYQAAKQSKKAKDAMITSAQKFTEKAKDAVKMIAVQNRGIFATVAIFGLIFVLIAASFTSCSASLQGASSAIISTSYSSTDEDIYAAENAYRALEEALNTQINQMESTHPDYDEYRYQIDEIGHNPYQLISYLTVKYGGFTYDEVAEEIESIFRQQYGITTDSTRETVTETKTVRVGESLGQVVTSGYCNCSICCGQWSGGPTASGAMPTANHTIAVDASNPFVPMGTHVIMNGVEYVVEDTGAFARYGVQFDVYYDNHAAASAHGHQTWEAYIADSNGSQEVQVTTTKEVNRLDVTMTNRNLDTVLRSRMTEEEQERYDAYNKYYGNRDYLFDLNSIPTGSGGFGYTIPTDALSDPQFAKMIREAEKYLGVPYVWGGYSPSGFDCSGFVSWVINNCGNGWNIGRCTADGLRSHCSQVSPSEAKPGDLIFFQGTYNTSGASHVGIYVGNNMMISRCNIQVSQVPTGRNTLWHLVVCIRGGDRQMNMKLKKILDDIQKTEDKIAELQEHLKRQNTLKQQMEDMEIIKSFRSMKLDSRELLVLLDGIQKGTVMIQMNEDGGITVEDTKETPQKESDNRPPVGQVAEREVLDDEE